MHSSVGAISPSRYLTIYHMPALEDLLIVCISEAEWEREGETDSWAGSSQLIYSHNARDDCNWTRPKPVVGTLSSFALGVAVMRLLELWVSHPPVDSQVYAAKSWNYYEPEPGFESRWTHRHTWEECVFSGNVLATRPSTRPQDFLVCTWSWSKGWKAVRYALEGVAGLWCLEELQH